MKAILIIGVGSIGERHLRCFQGTGRCKVAACESNETLRQTIGDRYVCDTYASWQEALASAKWDAAVICTPAHTHIPIATAWVEKSVPVLIEKPLSVSLDGISELIDKGAGNHTLIRVAYVHRSIPVVLAAQEVVSSGKLGDIRHVVVNTGQNFAVARPAYASTYFANRATGGGAIQDALTHTLHAVEWVVGPIERLFCDASHEVLAQVDVEDTVNLNARLRGGASASFSLNQFQAPNEVTMSFHGAKGSVRAELHRQRFGVQMQGEPDWTWKTPPAEERDGMFIRQANAFLDAMDALPDNLATLEDGLQTLKVNLAALQSADTRQEVIVK